MTYGTNWIRKNLGITITQLRGYEGIGVVKREPSHTARDFSVEELRALMKADMLHRIGFRLMDIRALLVDGETKLLDSMDGYIGRLEAQLREVQRNLGFAKLVRLTGMLPDMPDPTQEEALRAFRENLYTMWNVDDDASLQGLDRLCAIQTRPETEWSVEDGVQVQQLMRELQSPLYAQYEAAAAQLMSLQELDAAHPQVQACVEQMYRVLYPQDESAALSREEYAAVLAQMYGEGALGRATRREIGDAAVEFYVRAMRVFAGLES